MKNWLFQVVAQQLENAAARLACILNQALP
jgi:hypothetical protein